MSISKRYRIAITKEGLHLTQLHEPLNGIAGASIVLSPVDALELLRTLYGCRDLLLSGVLPSFNAVTHCYLCPGCKKSMVRMEADSLRWHGYCFECNKGFELDVAGNFMGKLGRR